MNRLNLMLALAVAAISITGCSVLTPGDERGELIVTYREVRAGSKNKEHYDSKCVIYVDGKVAAESEVGDRYDSRTVTLNLAPGTHTIVVEGMALKNGKWENITKENGYALDHRFEKTLDIRAGGSQSLNFIAPDRTEDIRIKF